MLWEMVVEEISFHSCNHNEFDNSTCLISVLQQFVDYFLSSDHPAYFNSFLENSQSLCILTEIAAQPHSNEIVKSKLTALIHSIEKLQSAYWFGYKEYCGRNVCSRNLQFQKWMDFFTTKIFSMRTFLLLYLLILFASCQSLIINADKSYRCYHVNATFGEPVGLRSMHIQNSIYFRCDRKNCPCPTRKCLWEHYIRTE